MDNRKTATKIQMTIRMLPKGMFSTREATAYSGPFWVISVTRSTMPLFCIHRPVGETVVK